MYASARGKSSSSVSVEASNLRTAGVLHDATIAAASTSPRSSGSAESAALNPSRSTAPASRPFSVSSLSASARVPLPSGPIEIFLPRRSPTRRPQPSPRQKNQSGS